MRSFSYYRNKHFLGELTLGDLMCFAEIEGDFSIGRNWLPISRFKKLGKLVRYTLDDLEAWIKEEGLTTSGETPKKRLVSLGQRFIIDGVAYYKADRVLEAIGSLDVLSMDFEPVA